MFLLVVSLGFAVPVSQHLLSTGTTGSTSSTGTSSSGSGDSNGTSSSGEGTSDGTSGTSGTGPDSPGPDSPGASNPTEPEASGPSGPSSSGPDGGDPDADGGRPGTEDTGGTSGSGGTDDDRPSVPEDLPQRVGDVFVTTILALPFWLPLYCLAGILDDADALPEGVPRDVARGCGNIEIADLTDGSGTSGTSDAPSTVDDDTPIKVEVLPPLAGRKKPQVRVTPMPADDPDGGNDLLLTLLALALFVIVVLVVALVLVLRRRRRP